jgi:hypothetical protein
VWRASLVYPAQRRLGNGVKRFSVVLASQ